MKIAGVCCVLKFFGVAITVDRYRPREDAEKLAMGFPKIA
jgi:hypothetical protein